MEALGAFFDSYAVYLVLALLAVNLFLIFWVFYLHKRFKGIFRDKGLDIDGVLLELRRGQETHEKEIVSAKGKLQSLEAAHLKGISKVGLVRHNPFSDSGGDQSFAVALLNDHKDGVVVSSLYGRAINRVYAKPVQNGKSKYQLSMEEMQAIEEAFR